MSLASSNNPSGSYMPLSSALYRISRGLSSFLGKSITILSLYMFSACALFSFSKCSNYGLLSYLNWFWRDKRIFCIISLNHVIKIYTLSINIWQYIEKFNISLLLCGVLSVLYWGYWRGVWVWIFIKLYNTYEWICMIYRRLRHKVGSFAYEKKKYRLCDFYWHT